MSDDKPYLPDEWVRQAAHLIRTDDRALTYVYGHGYLSGVRDRFSRRVQWGRLLGWMAAAACYVMGGALWRDLIGMYPLAIICGVVLVVAGFSSAWLLRPVSARLIKRHLDEVEREAQENAARPGP